MLKIKIFQALFFLFFLLFNEVVSSSQQLFINNCSACHLGGTNIIIPEKNLKKETLDSNGLNSIPAISYQIRNGKNGMPAFGGRLTEEEIFQISSYIFYNY